MAPVALNQRRQRQSSTLMLTLSLICVLISGGQVQGDCIDTALEACAAWGKFSKHDNGCKTLAKGWKAGNYTGSCHSCGVVSKNYSKCDVTQCQALCADLYTGKSTIGYCNDGCTKMKEILTTTACSCSPQDSSIKACPGGNYYKLLPGTSLTQPQAISQSYAASYNGVQGHLLTIESKKEADCINSLIAPNKPYWLGADNEDEEAVWEWEIGPSEGSVFWTSSQGTQDGFYSNWDRGEPGPSLGENCAGTNTLGKWHDWPCSTQNHFYTIVEFETSSALEGYVLVGVGSCRTTAEDHFNVVRSGQRCINTDNDVDLGYADSEATCAAMCSAVDGCGHVLYGYNQNRGQCLQTSAKCSSIYNESDYDVLSLNTGSQVGMGKYTVIENVDIAACALACSNNQKCVAIEFNEKLQRCEIHTQPVTRVLTLGGNAIKCYDKVQVATEWLKVGNEVCIDPVNTPNTAFTVPESLLAHEFKLVHTRGKVECLEWTACAPNSGTCQCNGLARYGYQYGNRWTYKNSTQSINCTKEAFDAPYSSFAYRCECSSGEPMRPTVTCNFTVDNAVKSVFYNGKDITGNVLPARYLSTWTQDKSVTFVEEPGASFVIQGVEASDCHGCTCSGFQMQCDATDQSSPWHKLTSGSPGWRAKESDTGVFTDADRAGTGQSNIWNTPCTSTSAFHMQSSPPLRKIWSEGGKKYALFAITPSDTLPQSDGIVANVREKARFYSSVWNNNSVGVGHARSMLDSAQAWSSIRNVAGEWMAIDLGFPMDVAGIVEQGRNDINQYVTSYSVSYSLDNITYTPINGSFVGGIHATPSPKVKTVFGRTYRARYVKLAALKWIQHISMRAAVLVDRPVGACVEGKGCCPSGYRADALNVGGKGMQFHLATDIIDCKAKCDGRTGCTEFEFNPEQPLINCGTYTNGTVGGGLSIGPQWLTCVKADSHIELGPICKKMRTQSEDTCADGDGGSEFCDAFVESQDSCLQHCSSRGLTCSGAWQSNADDGNCPRTQKVSCSAPFLSKVCRCTPKVPTFRYDGTKRTYDDSKKYCSALGYSIASVHNDDEAKLIAGLVATTSYLGATTNGDGKWKWEDGTAFNYINPLNDGLKGTKESNLAVEANTGKWHDWENGNALLGVVCRKNPGFVRGLVGQDACPLGSTPIRDPATCDLASASLGLTYNSSNNSDVGTPLSVCFYCPGCTPKTVRVSAGHGTIAEWICLVEDGTELVGATNLLLGQTPKVSDHWNKELFPASYLTDGKLPADFDFAGKGFWHSNGSDTVKSLHWAEVPLAFKVAVTHVVVWNRADCCHVRINGAVIFVIDAQGTKHQCGASIVTAGPGKPIQVNCTFARPASSVRIELPTGKWLQLYEIQAFGNPLDVEPPKKSIASGFWGCSKDGDAEPMMSVKLTSAAQTSLVPSRDDYNYRAATGQPYRGFGYYLQGYSPKSSEVKFEAPGNKIPLYPGAYTMSFDTTVGATGLVCADIYVNGRRDQDDWDVLAVEKPGDGLGGTELDSDPLRLLNFPGFEDTALAGGDYFVRLQWNGSDYMQFHVPAGSNVLSQVHEDKNIAVDQVLTTVTTVRYYDTANFCHACVTGGAKYGDTCWGVLPATDRYRACGCSAANNYGQGMYYGGMKDADVCESHGGGFTGVKTFREQKGNLQSIGLKLSIRSECASYEYFNTSLKHDQCQLRRICTDHDFETVRPTWKSDRECHLCSNLELCKAKVVGQWTFKTDDTKNKDDVTEAVGEFIDIIPSSVRKDLTVVASGIGGNALRVQKNVGLDTKRWLPAGAKSISFSIRASSFGSKMQFFSQSGTNQFYFGVDKSRVFIGAGITNVPAELYLLDTRPNEFHPFVLVDDGEGVLTMYQDGQLLGSIDYEGDTATNYDSSFIIGGVGSYDIANVTVYSTELTQLKIKTLAGPSAHYNHPPDSKEWQLVMRHDSSKGVFWPKDSLSQNANSADPALESMFARVNELEAFRSHEGMLTFKMVWPNVCDTNDCTGDENNFITWRQKSNPSTESGTSGYEELSLGFWSAREQGVSFGGLEYSGTYTLMDGNVNHDNWWYAAGSYQSYKGVTTFPGPKRDYPEPGVSALVSLVELYAFNYSFETGIDNNNPCPTTKYSKLGRACCRAADGSNAAGPVKLFQGASPSDCRKHCDDEGVDCQGFEFRPTMINQCELHFGPISHIQFNQGGIECSCFIRTEDQGPPRIFLNTSSGRCQDFTNCVQDEQYEQTAPTATTDRVCAICTEQCTDVAGTYLDGDCTGSSTPTCISCPAGSYCEGNTKPKPCPPKFYSNTGAVACTPCVSTNANCVTASYAGVYEKIDGTVDTCPCGSYCPKGSLQKFDCPSNTSAIRPGMPACIPCSDGQFTRESKRDTCYWISNQSAVSPFTALCESPDGKTFSPIAAPTVTVYTPPPSAQSCTVTFTASVYAPKYKFIRIKGSWDWGTQIKMQQLSAGKWSADIEVPRGQTYEWGVTYGQRRNWLLDEPSTACGDTNQNGGNCKFTISQSCTVNGDIDVTALKPPKNPTVAPTSVQFQQSFPVSIQVFANFTTNPHTTITITGTQDYSIRDKKMKRTYPVWTETTKLPAGEYRWGVIAENHQWLLGSDQTYCGETIDRGFEPATECVFSISETGVISGDIKIHLSDVTMSNSATTAVPQGFSTTTASSSNSNANTKSGGANTVSVIIGAVVSIIVIVGAVVWYFKRKMGKAQVVLSRNVHGEIVGTVAFDNPSYNDIPLNDIRADNAMYSTVDELDDGQNNTSGYMDVAPANNDADSDDGVAMVREDMKSNTSHYMEVKPPSDDDDDDALIQ